ncbi:MULTISPECIES: exodeoxyribonuclease VII large subunit [Vitreoscilla]|uniref:Exodeoxyribonuclease 7 large subunit n=1 Tax=Vitreoscilla stercoraria TaxID=61 RepID=A0ABY4EF41_VITST|nr:MULTISPECIES: exodeoxyribonuclease VII large subunit [Vitreoscilla]AUZ05087.1 large subunit of exodeoxyribonuclease 7 [Vitreoscilla sp. C1]UOO93555.1 exodeoxyribonuclease VII large subunit [Vitreoscilla stercoraria]
MSDHLFSPPPLAVSQLNALARQLLEQNLANVWVSGEISNLNHASSGHYYFSLKDQQAQVRCALFKSYADRLTTPLREGEHIELTGKITLYEARGEFQINVTQLRSSGMGTLFEAYERLKQQLAQEGLFDEARKQELPAHPQTIGIVTSTATAALRDVVATLNRRMSALNIIVYPTPVQGKSSHYQIAQAIATADARQEVDVLIVCRGGGSIEDLWAFNEEVVLRAIAECSIPVISGVGHETDVTLSDFAADVRAPTPTGAAEMVSPDAQAWRQYIASLHNVMHTALQRRYQDLSQRIDWYARQVKHPNERIATQRQQLRQQQQQLDYSMQNLLRQRTQYLQWQQAQLQAAAPSIKQWQQTLQQQQQLLQQAWQQQWQNQHQRLKRQQVLLEALSPQQVLERGFSVIKNRRGKVITSADDLKFGQHIDIVFHSSDAAAQVTRGSPQQGLFD